jgi:hypothetical protein
VAVKKECISDAMAQINREPEGSLCWWLLPPIGILASLAVGLFFTKKLAPAKETALVTRAEKGEFCPRDAQKVGPDSKGRGK